MTCFPSQTPFFELYNQNNCRNDNNTNNNNHNHDSTMDLEIGPLTAQFILFTSLQKLDQAKRSRGGIRLRRGLLIAVTALKAKQLLWQQQDHYAQLKLAPPTTLTSTLPASVPRSQTQPLSVSTMNSFYPLPNFSTSPVRDDGQVRTDQTNNFYSSPSLKKMDYDDSNYSASQCVSGPPCFPPSPDELLQEEENSFCQPTFNPSPSKRFRLDLGLNDAQHSSSTEGQNFHSSNSSMAIDCVSHSCCSSCVGIG